MGRKKLIEESQPVVVNINEDDVDLLEEAPKKPYIVLEASIKDDLCQYKYEITAGTGVGDIHSVKGKGIIDPDMQQAFADFNVHLACIDDMFKHGNIEVDSISTMHGHHFATLFNVTGFKIKGSEDYPQIVLVGNKYVSSAGGRIEIESPKIPLDNLSSYKWYNELREATDNARREVELYMEGKYTMPEEPEEKPNRKQAKLFDMSVETDEENDLDDDFSNAAL